jgi:hypothetical protein
MGQGMSLSNYDKFFRLGLFVGLGTIGGYAGAVGVMPEFSATSYLTYAFATAVGGVIGMDIAEIDTELPPPEPEDKDIYERYFESQNPPPLTEEEQNNIFKKFLWKAGGVMLGVAMGLSSGFFVGHQLVKVQNHFRPAAEAASVKLEPTKNIFKEQWNYNFKPKGQAPAP